MASFTKVSLLRSGVSRAYCAQAVPVAGSVTCDVKTTVLPNKMIVASVENDSPITRVSILFKAGPRNEGSDNLGSAHMLRLLAGASTRSHSQFSIARHLAQAGVRLSCATDREVFWYTLEGTCKAVQVGLPFLTAVTTEQLFHPWEISEIENHLRLELSSRSPQLRVIDLLHKAAFRTGLGNSLCITKYNIGKISSETLQQYVCCNFTANRAAVVGMGMDHEDLVRYAETLQLEGGDDGTGSGVYKGGEIRSDKEGNLAYVAIAGEGGALNNSKEVRAFSVLQAAYGMGPSIKYSHGNGNILTKAIGEMNGPHSISAINASYFDSGLFGVFVIGNETIAEHLVTTAAKTLKSVNVTEADVNRGKKKVLVEFLSSAESGSNALEEIGRQAVLMGTAKSPSQIADEINAVSTADVEAAARKVASSKLSIAGVGNLRSVPFLDDLN